MKRLLFFLLALLWCNATHAATYSGEWVQSGGGVLRPRNATTQTITSNLLSAGRGDFYNTLSVIPIKQTLLAGTNNVYAYTNSSIKLLATNSNPAITIVRLEGGTNTGQWCLLTHYGTNSGFTLPNGSTNSLGGKTYLAGNQDWVPTNTFDKLLLSYDFPDWTEIGRSSPTNGNGNTFNVTPGYVPAYAGGNQWTNSAVRMIDGLANAEFGYLIVTNGTAKDAYLILVGSNGYTATINLALGEQLNLTGTNGITANAGSSSIQFTTAGNTWLWFGNTLIPGTSNTHAVASSAVPLFAVYVATNAGSGLVLGTNIISDNGSSVTRNGVPIGGSSEINTNAQFGLTIDGSGAVISTGQKGFYRIPTTMTVTAWKIIADQSASCVLDVWTNTWANASSLSVANTMFSGNKPTLSNQQTNANVSLSIPLRKDDFIAWNVDSASVATRVQVFIYGTIP